MLHLPAERLAALADHSHCPGVEPTPEERSHLSLCAACTREVRAITRLVDEARREVDRVTEPLSPWAEIAAALRSEGLIADDAGSGKRIAGSETAMPHAEALLPFRPRSPLVARRSTRPSTRWAGRIAAGLAFVAVGAMAGRATAGGARAGTTAVPTRADTVVAASRALGQGIARNANLLLADTVARFASTAEALTALTTAERQYERAAAFLVEHDSSSQPTDSSQLYRARLAALDNVMAATREALYDAPHDPLINRYYLATMGAREATLRQLGTSLPQGERISRY
jgi:hypothetical protein